jgi:hypothetical protein
MPDEERLLDLLVEQAPAGITSTDWMMQQLQQGGKGLAPYALLGLIDNCQDMLPKCAHLAVSLLSMIAPRHPTALVATMDAEPLAASISGYLRDVFARITFVPCLVEEVYGVNQVLNTIPLLYHLGDLAEANVVLARHKLPVIIAPLSINMLHRVHTGSAQDKPLEFARFP